jgi:hypothetical protein
VTIHPGPVRPEAVRAHNLAAMLAEIAALVVSILLGRFFLDGLTAGSVEGSSKAR